jgi:UDP-2,3-diacylglucosamine pyrophosphatase LpxH
VQKRRSIQRINQSRSWVFEKINKIDKPLAILTKGNRDSILINKIRSEKGEITTESEEIQKNHQILLHKTILNTTGKPG